MGKPTHFSPATRRPAGTTAPCEPDAEPEPPQAAASETAIRLISHRGHRTFRVYAQGGWNETQYLDFDHSRVPPGTETND